MPIKMLEVSCWSAAGWARNPQLGGLTAFYMVPAYPRLSEYLTVGVDGLFIDTQHDVVKMNSLQRT
jgi:hypothetical protein